MRGWCGQGERAGEVEQGVEEQSVEELRFALEHAIVLVYLVPESG